MPQGKDKECLCKGTGQQTKKIYALRDFECDCGHIFFQHNSEGCQVLHREGDDDIYCDCETEYKIPFKDYEIKTAREIDNMFKNKLIKEEEIKWINTVYEHNLKEDDKVVIV